MILLVNSYLQLIAVFTVLAVYLQLAAVLSETWPHSVIDWWQTDSFLWHFAGFSDSVGVLDDLILQEKK